MIMKFRAWDKRHKQMGQVKGWSEFNGGEVTLKRNDQNASYVVSADDTVLVQSTGLFDKNGVEIFEGDVVLEDGWRKVIVSFGTQEIEENFGDIRIFQGFNLDLGCGYPTAIKSSFEVLGNIYENLNLLEVDK